ncbi:MAG: endonuclease III [Verrucomicrobiota bacterium]|jgi:endonuclease-3|nr:endonuclease III [Verrucomicrobiota bacterium]
MPHESQATKRERLGKIIAGLKQTYPDAHCELNYRNPLQLMVATILSAQCTDKQVNIVTKDLFKKHKKAADFTAVPLEELQNDIRRIGLFRNKAKSIQNACCALVEHHKGKVPNTMAELVALAGVGRKTANVILGNAFDINEGVVVDTHVARLCDRLKISSAKTPEKIEKDLVKLVPREHWTMFSHWIIWHGRRRCDARKPDCPNCEIRELCPSAA